MHNTIVRIQNRPLAVQDCLMGYYCVSEQYTLTNAQFCGEMLMLRVRDLFLEIGLLVLFFSSMSV